MNDKNIFDKIEALQDLKRYRQAIQLCLNHIGYQNEHNDALHCRLIECYICLDDLKNAEKFTKQALAKYPNNSDFYFYYAQIFNQKKLYDYAIEYIDKALALEPNFANYWYWKADILDSQLEYLEAKECILKALKENSNDTDFLNLYAIILLNLDDDKYNTILDKILSIDPHNIDALRLKAALEKTWWKQKQAYLKTLKLNPFDDTLHSLLKKNKLEFIAFFSSLFISLAILLTNLYFNVPVIANISLVLILIISLMPLVLYKIVYLFIFIAWFYVFYDTHQPVLSIIALSVHTYVSKLVLMIIKGTFLLISEYLTQLKNSREYKPKVNPKEFILAKIPFIVSVLIVGFYFLHIPQQSLKWTLYTALPFLLFFIQMGFDFKQLKKETINIIVTYGFLAFFNLIINGFYQPLAEISFEWVAYTLSILLTILIVYLIDFRDDDISSKNEENK
ncbi:tetratricopeptide repeat protein [Phocoenobacter skyensis]|uniref:Tetratricopeptide repeat-containing protein n=1 Tax=Phocoenobacter skyensis TaxID=97481 RepID=A0A1H7VJY7_9PAST|nr:CDC27 family protein [Pasteurella skyensis]MDP8078813.1 hypothetical protein [Pasteurella skyensis]MDP8084874.1 hypothetical protein [Pasteurella skyensis]MDP8185484.1 hypothetical protein [Pasteurella skyensis]QLB22458.1 hypothetical protein A6B44_04270 [Pasteurella skyensis]SEM09591.1 Tetratricopeptide repeat-containing protein [Pasteurella skyensis]